MRIGRVSDVSQVPVPGLSMSRTSRLSHDAQGRNDVSGLLTCPTLASPTLDHAPACDSLHCTWSACHGWSKSHMSDSLHVICRMDTKYKYMRWRSWDNRYMVIVPHRTCRVMNTGRIMRGSLDFSRIMETRDSTVVLHVVGHFRLMFHVR